MASDKTILEHIAELVDEEQQLRKGTAPTDGTRLKHLEDQLDQCWDLLRQRRARREFGEDPDDTAVRDVRTVRGYIG